MLRLLLLSALAAAPAAGQGFGGEVDEASEAGEAGEAGECVVEVNGKMVRCEDVLKSERPTSKKRAPPPPPTRREAQPSSPAPAAEPQAEIRAAESPYQRALDENRAKMETTPLDAEREALRALEAKKTALEDSGAPREAQDALALEIEQARAVLEDLEERAEQRMLACARQRDGGWAKRYERGLQTTKMTPAGPVKIKPRGVAGFDLTGCERTRFVDEDLVQKVKRVHELRRLLERRWRYGERDQELKLRAELKALEQALDEKPRLQGWNRDPEAVDKMYIYGRE